MRPRTATGQHPVGFFQHIGVYFVELQPGLEPLSEIGESTRYKQHLQTRMLRGLQQPLGAWVELQLLLIDCLQGIGGQSA